MIPQELRIGNYYKSVKFGCTVKCDLSDLYDLCANADGATDHPPIDEMFKPIPLDTDWLEKFGFNYNDLNGDSGHWQKPHFEILEGEEDGFSYDYKLIVKYVHQLQSLYFDLTGEELQIK